MGFYDAFKDALNLAQKADNVELYRQLLDLSAQALDLQAENAKLRTELSEFQKEKELEDDIEYHKTMPVDTYHTEYPYITLKSDDEKIRYCAICWGKDHKLIPLYNKLNCMICRTRCKNE